MDSPFEDLGPSRLTEAALFELAQLPGETPLEVFLARACELSARTVDVERVSVWNFIDHGETLRCTTMYERSKNTFSRGTLLRRSDFPAYFAAVQLRRSIPAEFATNDPRTRELGPAYLVPLGISSLLDAGIFVDSALIGIICHEHVGAPREWTTEVRDFVSSLADAIALRIKSAESTSQASLLRLQEQRMEAIEKLSSLEQLSIGVTHDFRNLLTVVVGNGELLRRRDDMPDDARSLIFEILDVAREGIDLVGRLEDFAGQRGNPPSVVHLVDEVERILPILRSALGPKYALEFHAAPRIGTILLNAGEVIRIVMNLCVNARDAMAEGGQIDLLIETRPATSLTGRGEQEIVLTVRDYGIGIDPAVQARIFEPLFTTKQGGTGLGLPIVKRIIERAGGSVEVESEVGKGATVRVVLPPVGAVEPLV